MAHTKHRKRFRGMLPLLVLLFAMGLRVLYIPMHLAHEDHLGMDRHSSDTSQLASHGHDYGHNHQEHGRHGHGDPEEDGHTPHPITDHACDLIVARASTPAVQLLGAQLPLLEIGPQPVSRLFFTLAVEQEPRPPREPDRSPKRQRGPPAAS